MPTLSSSPKSLTTVKAKQVERELTVLNRESTNLVRNRSRRRGMTNPPVSETLRPTETLEIENGHSLVPCVKLFLTIHYADHSVKPLDEWQLKRSFTDFLKSSFSLTVPEDDIVVHRFKDLKKRKRDDPVTHGALFICDLGFLSKPSRSEILHGIDGEDDVKELEKKFLD